MKKFTVMLFFTVLLNVQVTNTATADTWVNGYTRDDGTYVEGHFRSDPDGYFWNNYSSYGNVNPYTGERGTKLPFDNNYGSFESSTRSDWSYDSSRSDYGREWGSENDWRYDSYDSNLDTDWGYSKDAGIRSSGDYHWYHSEGSDWEYDNNDSLFDNDWNDRYSESNETDWGYDSEFDVGSHDDSYESTFESDWGYDSGYDW
ncbi:hypothetical protein [Alteribacillus iranensis]|uniref:Uncharacterized protein n=1 Tax=Alteribacillus iranensis TaxID=930128 RepID=A0A1I2D3X5_9BACI|nr:hypothetical protein [Alteribacillus iranensis]SFE75211.1 hypothetical protein SAMN05192532_103392 [Alteribacillus iranensis]